MANGFISGLAGMRAAQGAGSGWGSFLLGSSAMEDLRKLERQEHEYKEEERLSGKAARDREDKRGKNRLVGAAIGLGLGLLTGGASNPLWLALTTGGASYAGQRMGQGGVSLKTPLGRKHTLRKIVRGDDNVFFHAGKQRKLEGYRKDLNDFLTEADRRFDQSITTSALSDAYLAYQAGSLDWKGLSKNIKNLKNLPSLAKGDISWGEYKNLIEGGARIPSDKGIGIGSKLGRGSLDKTTGDILKRMSMNKEYYGQSAFIPNLGWSPSKGLLPSRKKFDLEEALNLINKAGE
jgi:hypothetical protein